MSGSWLRERLLLRRIAPIAWIGAWAAILAIGYAAPGLAARRAQRLSAPGLPQSDIYSQVKPQVSPDSEWVVYAHDPNTAFARELFAVRRWGGTPVRLSALLPTGSAIFRFEITPDSRRVVYEVDQEVTGQREIYSVPIGGPAGASVQVSPEPGAGEEARFFYLASSGQRVVSILCATNCLSIWSAPVDGSSAPIQLSDPIAADRQITPGLTVAPGSDRLIYLSDRLVLGHLDLWSVPADGSAPPVKLNPALVAGGGVNRGLVSPDGSRVFYVADQLVDERFELFSVPIAGPSTLAIKLSGPMQAAGDVASASFSPDGQWVIYTADQTIDEKRELYSVPADGSASWRQLNAALIPAGDVQEFTLDPLSEYVAYIADAAIDEQQEIFSVPIAGPAAAAVRLNGTLTANGDVGGTIALADPGRHLLYVADAVIDERYEVWSAPYDGSSAAFPISGSMVAGGDAVGFAYANLDQTRVVLIEDRLVDERFDLYSVPVDGSTAPLLLSGTPVATGDVTSVVTYPATQEVVFRADRGSDEQFNLYATTATVDNPAPPVLNPLGLPQSDVYEAARAQSISSLPTATASSSSPTSTSTRSRICGSRTC